MNFEILIFDPWGFEAQSLSADSFPEGYSHFCQTSKAEKAKSAKMVNLLKC